MPYNPDIHHRRNIRLKGYDYSQAGMYFVTICVQNRQCLFGKISDSSMVLNDAGKIAYDEWMKTPDLRSNVQLGAFVVMPNHVHGIIIISNSDAGRGVLHTPNNDTPNERTVLLHTPNDITPNDITQINKGVCDTPLRSPSNTVGAIVRGYKSAVSKQLGYSIWQRNFYEIIIRNEQSFQYIENYIINNPVKWNNDKFYSK
jgi:REP element-mobilizing transposase RayT